MISTLLKKQFLLSCIILCAVFLSSCASMGSISSSTDTGLDTPADVQTMLQKGDEALARGAFDDAQVQFALAVKEQPDNSELLYRLAFVHYEKGTHDVAQDLLTRIVKLDNANAGAFEMLGFISLKNEKLKAAEKHLDKTLTMDRNRWRSLNAMGILRDLQSRHDEAQTYFLEARLLGPSKAQIENNLGYSYYLQGKDMLAMKQFRKATQLDSTYDKAWANLGLVFVRQKHYEEARFAFAKIVDEATVANNLGYLAMLQGDFKTATRELTNAIQLAPTHYATANENLVMAQQRAENQQSTQVKNNVINPKNIVVVPASYRAPIETDKGAEFAP